MTQSPSLMASLDLQDVTHQLVQQFIAELQDMLDGLIAGDLSAQQSNVLNKIVGFFDTEMKRHHLEEEAHIFPVLLSKNDPVLREKVSMLKADHDELRSRWRDLRAAIEQMATLPEGDGHNLRQCFDCYSECFAKHLLLEESVQFSAEAKQLFKSWDA